MSDTELPVADTSKLSAALFDARRELIDLSRRNRLLHTTRTGKRAHCLEITGANIDELFAGLTKNNGKFCFLPTSDEDVEEIENSPHSEPPRGGLNPLQTTLAREVLERRLLKLFREARTFEEEQGTNILFIAIGFLRWFEDVRSEEPCMAPLLLVPVSLERRQGQHPFVMAGRDEDMIVNVSLAEKLRSTFSITLPEFPDNDEWTASSYLMSVTNAVSGQSRWNIDRGVGLGFFTFSKFLMWRDLDPSTWSNGHGLISNPVIARLLGSITPGESLSPLVDEKEAIDQHIDLASAVHVLNADSSQAVCIEEARLGRDLVVQGPPGTGKSQTIANMIAAAVGDGKSVLFVAEKAAALDVVHERLKAVGLSSLCLELHSRKATKISVIASLENAIRAAGASQTDGRTSNELRATRDRLNEWSTALHRPIRKSGRTPYRVMGTVLKLRAEGVRLLDTRLDTPADWDADELSHAEQLVERTASALSHFGIPIEQAWFGTLGSRLTPFDMDRLRQDLKNTKNALGTLLDKAAEVAGLLKIDQLHSCKELADSLANLDLIARAPREGRGVLANPAWFYEQPRVVELLRFGKQAAEGFQNLNETVADLAWKLEIGSMRRVIDARGKSIFRMFFSQYRKAMNDLKTMCRAKAPRKYEDRLALLDRIISAQTARSYVEREDNFGRNLLGHYWKGTETPWALVESLLDWALTARKADSQSLLEIAANADPDRCAKIAEATRSASTEFLATFARCSGTTKPDINVIFHQHDIEDARLVEIARKVDQWIAEPDSFNEWVGVRDCLDELRRLGLELIADRLASGTVAATEAKPVTNLLIAEALWRCAQTDNPKIAEIEGVFRSENVTKFRALDRRHIELARSEVLAAYSARKPGGDVGGMGIIRAEIGKKRRHLPIRRLIEKAGSAIQRLKPIFLMSPLSVAQFLPPGRLSFDLAIVDEASQVSPEEALGALGRCKQIVVVGDDKQLPPTNFFRMVADDEDPEEGDDAPTARTQDFESILTLARARGISQRMLRWHYRSRHPSLIAMSNQICYGGELLLPPNPIADASHLGLSLIKTPRGHYDRGGSGRNSAEADIVAEAVERHIAERPDHSLGIACFSVAQRDAIEDALYARGIFSEVEQFAPRGERLFVKNLESVQGDERDSIFISIGYGPDAQGRMTTGFGPLSAEGGERRLNVLISRAREECVVFSSITASDIPSNVAPRGTRMLRDFLHFAETGHIAAGEDTGADFDSDFEHAVAIAIRKNGFKVVPQVGVSGFKIDLGVVHPNKPGRFVLGVECDGAAYHSGRSARDRDRLRQEVLENLGWKLYRIWSTD